MKVESQVVLDLHATPGEVMRAVEALEKFGRSHRLSEKALFSLTLALEECGSNIVNHALRKRAEQMFRASFQRTDRAVTIELRDPGPEFDPTRAKSPPLTNADDARPPGGWGIELVRRFMDDMTYRRENCENVLLLTKYLELESPAL